MPIKFEIEHVASLKSGCYVFARHLTPGQHFEVTENSFLGEVALIKYLDIPRAINEKSQQRYDLFAFQIKNPEDRFLLKEGNVVALALRD